MSKRNVVIIGGGTAGLTIAHRLQDSFNVLIIERSGYKSYPLKYKMPLLMGLLYRRKTLKYVSRRELILPNQRRIPFFESNVLGGASVVNGCVHTVGSRNLWSSLLARHGLNYDDLMFSYESLYSKDRKELYKINIVEAPRDRVDDAFITSLSALGVAEGDTNFSDNENCGPVYDTVRRYFRTSVISLFRKMRFRTLIDEPTNELSVAKEEGQLVVRTSKREIKADDVILCAGVIGTNSLLLRMAKDGKYSDLFERLDVGQGVKDHTNLRVNVVTNRPIGSLNEIANSFQKKFWLLLNHLMGRPTLMLGTGATSAVHLDLDGDGQVDTRIHVVKFTETGRHGSDGRYFGDAPGFSLSITPINPLSNGCIRLHGDGEIVDPNYLSRKEDIDILKTALRYCLTLLRTEPLSSYIHKIVDEETIRDDPEAYIFNNIYSGHHLIGGAHRAVGSDFRVRGFDRLYVCDASIFPEYPASNIHSSVVLMADIFARKFIESRSVR